MQPTLTGVYASRRSVLAEAPMAGAIDLIHTVREICPASDEYRHEALSTLAIFLTEQGEATVQTGGRTLHHRPGSLILLNAGLPIIERVGTEQPWKVHYMMLSGTWADALGRTLAERDRGAVVYSHAPAPWQRQFSTLLEMAFEQGDGWNWAFLSGCAALFGWVTRYPASAEGADPLLDEVERLLDAEPGRAWSLDEIAAALGITVRQFDYRFRKAGGCAPALWLRQQRISAARRLLSEGRSVSETAETLGFSNPYHFSRVFKALTGMPPSAFSRAAAQDKRLRPDTGKF